MGDSYTHPFRRKAALVEKRQCVTGGGVSRDLVVGEFVWLDRALDHRDAPSVKSLALVGALI
jgi:hypothetical protein